MEIREVRSALGEGMHEERITRTPPSIPASRISSRSRAEANGIMIDHASRAAAVVCLSLGVLSRRACFWSFVFALERAVSLPALASERLLGIPVGCETGCDWEGKPQRNSILAVCESLVVLCRFKA